MKAVHYLILIAFIAMQAAVVRASELKELSESNYKHYGDNRSVIILQINWGRSWNCGGYENAQLHRLVFRLLPDNGQLVNPVSLELNIPSRLVAKDTFLPYVYIVEPGEYALSEFDVKVARSTADVGHLQATELQLFKDEKPIGGTFKANANEAVYIGTFGLDCYEEPIPWRFYIEGRDEFDRFVNGFRLEYPYIRSMPVSYRLFSTTTFGQPYSLEETESNAQ